MSSSDEELTLQIEDDDLGDYSSGQAGSENDAETGDDSESGEKLEENGSRKSDQALPSEWIEFNNTVVSMRPLFKSAKVQFANKLSRQIKMFRNRKGDPKLVEKFNRKADRLVEEISYVNRLKQDIIAKFALLHSKEEVTKIVNDPESPMEYRVKAKVAAMPKICKAADDYHRLHPDWRETLIKLIQMAGSKMKKKRRKMRGKGKPKKKKTSSEKAKNKAVPPKVLAVDDGTGRFDASNFPEPPPELDDLVANTDSSDQEGSDDENEWNQPSVRFGSSSDEEGDLKEGPEEEDLNLKRGRDKDLSEDSIKKTRKGSEKYHKKAEAERKLKPSKRKGDKVEISLEKKAKTSKDSEIRKPLEGETQLSMGSEGEESASDGEESDGMESRTNIDPFFITSDNKAYKTLWKVEPADSFKHHDNKKPKEPVMMFKNARTYEEVKSGKPDKRPKPFSKTDNKLRGKSENRALDPEKLHPSWQAKKKLNLTTAAFQGKKIVFDDD